MATYLDEAVREALKRAIEDMKRGMAFVELLLHPPVTKEALAAAITGHGSNVDSLRQHLLSSDSERAARAQKLAEEHLQAALNDLAHHAYPYLRNEVRHSLQDPPSSSHGQPPPQQSNGGPLLPAQRIVNDAIRHLTDLTVAVAFALVPDADHHQLDCRQVTADTSELLKVIQKLEAVKQDLIVVNPGDGKLRKNPVHFCTLEIAPTQDFIDLLKAVADYRQQGPQMFGDMQDKAKEEQAKKQEEAKEEAEKEESLEQALEQDLDTDAAPDGNKLRQQKKALADLDELEAKKLKEDKQQEKADEEKKAKDPWAKKPDMIWKDGVPERDEVLRHLHSPPLRNGFIILFTDPDKPASVTYHYTDAEGKLYGFPNGADPATADTKKSSDQISLLDEDRTYFYFWTHSRDHFNHAVTMVPSVAVPDGPLRQFLFVFQMRPSPPPTDFELYRLFWWEGYGDNGETRGTDQGAFEQLLFNVTDNPGYVWQCDLEPFRHDPDYKAHGMRSELTLDKTRFIYARRPAVTAIFLAEVIRSMSKAILRESSWALNVMSQMAGLAVASRTGQRLDSLETRAEEEFLHIKHFRERWIDDSRQRIKRSDLPIVDEQRCFTLFDRADSDIPWFRIRTRRMFRKLQKYALRCARAPEHDVPARAGPNAPLVTESISGKYVPPETFDDAIIDPDSIRHATEGAVKSSGPNVFTFSDMFTTEHELELQFPDKQLRDAVDKIASELYRVPSPYRLDHDNKVIAFNTKTAPVFFTKELKKIVSDYFDFYQYGRRVADPSQIQFHLDPTCTETDPKKQVGWLKRYEDAQAANKAVCDQLQALGRDYLAQFANQYYTPVDIDLHCQDGPAAVGGLPITTSELMLRRWHFLTVDFNYQWWKDASPGAPKEPEQLAVWAKRFSAAQKYSDATSFLCERWANHFATVSYKELEAITAQVDKLETFLNGTSETVDLVEAGWAFAGFKAMKSSQPGSFLLVAVDREGNHLGTGLRAYAVREAGAKPGAGALKVRVSDAAEDRIRELKQLKESEMAEELQFAELDAATDWTKMSHGFEHTKFYGEMKTAKALRRVPKVFASTLQLVVMGFTLRETLEKIKNGEAHFSVALEFAGNVASTTTAIADLTELISFRAMSGNIVVRVAQKAALGTKAAFAYLGKIAVAAGVVFEIVSDLTDGITILIESGKEGELGHPTRQLFRRIRGGLLIVGASTAALTALIVVSAGLSVSPFAPAAVILLVVGVIALALSWVEDLCGERKGMIDDQETDLLDALEFEFDWREEVRKHKENRFVNTGAKTVPDYPISRVHHFMSQALMALAPVAGKVGPHRSRTLTRTAQDARNGATRTSSAHQQSRTNGGHGGGRTGATRSA